MVCLNQLSSSVSVSGTHWILQAGLNVSHVSLLHGRVRKVVAFFHRSAQQQLCSQKSKRRLRCFALRSSVGPFTYCVFSACKSVIIFKCSRAAGALIMGSTRSRRACNSQLLRMPQAHRRSCDKNQPISYGLSVTKHQKLSRTADHSCTWWFLYLISINISRSKTNARARNHLSFAETSWSSWRAQFMVA